MNLAIISFALSLVITLCIMPFLIPALRKLKFGQTIREEGPNWHQKKSGTPTIGGLGFIIASVVASVAVVLARFGFRLDLLIPIFTALAYGVVGFADDYIKVVKKQNLGLSAKAKFIALFAVALISTSLMYYLGILDGEMYIPFWQNPVDIGFFIVPLIILVHLAVTNSVNLTDGVDGLATGVTAVVSLFFTGVALFFFNDMSIFAAAVLGGCIGFLFFNAHPAKVFMGDTGSLFLGGAIAVIATSLKMPLILIIAGGIYLWETLSVILQVASFKTTGKRIFKMSPFHHHLEMCGWNEVKIGFIFSMISLFLCVIAAAGILTNF